jgi:hypothetical protein
MVPLWLLEDWIARWRLRRAFRKLNKSLRRTAESARVLGEAMRQGAETFKAFAEQIAVVDQATAAHGRSLWEKAHPEYAVHPVVYNAIKVFGKQSAQDSRTPASREDEEKDRKQ